MVSSENSLVTLHMLPIEFIALSLTISEIWVNLWILTLQGQRSWPHLKDHIWLYICCPSSSWPYFLPFPRYEPICGMTFDLDLSKLNQFQMLTYQLIPESFITPWLKLEWALQGKGQKSRSVLFNLGGRSTIRWMRFIEGWTVILWWTGVDKLIITWKKWIVAQKL